MVAPVDLALSTMMTLKNDMDITANNLANKQTHGFQSSFMPYVSDQRKSKHSEIISFTHDVTALKDKTQGPMIRTDNPLHVYLNGDGYFSLQTDRGIRYSRAGVFTTNAEGQLVNLQGDLVLDEGFGPITLPEGEANITISKDGTLSFQGGVIARLGYFRFENPFDITQEEGTLINTQQQPLASERASIVQYAHEGSNVNGILQSTRMIRITKTFEEMQRLVHQQHELTSHAIESDGRSLTV